MKENPRNNQTQFQAYYEGFGEVSIRPMAIERDIPMLHDWVNRDYAVFWGLQGSSIEQVRAEYIKLSTPEHYNIFIGEFNQAPAFLLEQYDPAQDLIREYYPVQPGECGVHIIVAPPVGKPIHNFTYYLFHSVMDFIFSDLETVRILVEPDIRNKKMFALCERIGFQLDKIIELPHKTAQLAFLSKERFRQLKTLRYIKKRSTMNTLDNVVSAQQAVSHLTSEVWGQVNTLLIKKALCEFSHERLLTPTVTHAESDGWNRYRVQSDFPTIYYEFRAKSLALQHYWIDTSSIVKWENGKKGDLDAILFIKEFIGQLGIRKNMLPTYLEEITSTLQSAAFKHTKEYPIEARELALADFQTIEQSMTEGHPGFVANNGRIGFDSSDYRAYAPETGNSFPLLWLAGHKVHTKYAAIDSLPYDKMIDLELGEEVVHGFEQVIRDKGYQPNDYFFIPMHPWQWFNKLVHVFAPEIAKGKLICLGYGPDQYVAQQSIRTLFNSSNPKKCYTKTALSILNMGFMRGLPYYYLGTAPKMATWLEGILYNDPYIQETGFRMLSEIASVSYENPYYEEFGPHNDYNKMLASLWRESPFTVVKENQTPMTMAAFLHVDHQENALLPEIIKTSGLSIENWLRHYFKVYLSPIIHCFYQFDLVFMPHGENVIMVMENNIPVRILLKDITEEACILSPDVKLPDHLSRMFAKVPEDIKLLSIFTDVFDGFFRFVSHILQEHAGFSEEHFWKLVAENIVTYQHRHPLLANKFKKYDLFTPEFHLSCLNRLQLNNHRTMIDLDDPVALLQFAGTLKNPVAPYKDVLTEEMI